MSKGKKELIQLLATEYDIPLKEVKKIVSAQSSLVVKTIREGRFDAVRLPFFGVFKAKPNRLKYIKNVKREAIGIRRGARGKAK